MKLTYKSLVAAIALAVFTLTTQSAFADQTSIQITQNTDVNAEAWRAIGIYDAYQALGLTPETAGLGVRVAVIDSGIGVSSTSTLDCFKASSQLQANFAGQTPYANSKVPVARSAGSIPGDRASKSTTPTSAAAVMPHGSHVAGVIGCNPNVNVTIHGTVLGTMTGIAPGVTLGSYNVFPDQAAVSINDIGNMVIAAVDDKMNVINMSLGIVLDGDPFGFGSDTGVLEQALAYAEANNVLVVAAAGNDGVDSIIRPANTSTVLSVGAVSGGVNAVHQLNVNKEAFTALGGSVGWSNTAVTGDIYPTSGKIQDGCSKLSASYQNKIAILQRGSCFFEVKFKSAKAAGAIGVILVDKENSPADLHLSSENATDPILPGGIISPEVWEKIQAELKTQTSPELTIYPTKMVTVPIGTMMSFSSYQSTGDLRPDLVAPGGGIISSITGIVDKTENTACSTCYMVADGTSMASPVVVAVAALLYQLHPTWTVQMIRSALIHTASTSYVKAVGSKADPGPRVRGTGVIDALAAVNATLGFATSSTKLIDKKASVTILNPTDQDITAKVSTTGVVLSTTTSILIPAKSSATVEVTAQAKGLGEIILTPQTGSQIHQNLYG